MSRSSIIVGPLAALVAALLPGLAIAQSADPGAFPATARPADASVAPRAAAIRTPTAPAIDGRLDDAAWSGAPVIALFVQRDPDEGVPASEATEVRIAYDDEAMYIAARMHDRGTVTSRLGRRDMVNTSSDWFRVSLDSYYDRRSAFRFEVNPAGVRRDAAISGGGGNAGDGDLAWDAVWDAAATIDADGWTAEMRIPFSQLRFTAADEQTWGLQTRAADRSAAGAVDVLVHAEVGAGRRAGVRRPHADCVAFAPDASSSCCPTC